jgi:SPP1 family predicted phage head-tail adaptor
MTIILDRQFSKITFKIKIRYIDGVNASMRLVYDSRVFNFIHTKDVMERTKEIEILAWEQNTTAQIATFVKCD